jgi:hypothetical protein
VTGVSKEKTLYQINYKKVLTPQKEDEKKNTRWGTQKI